MTMITLGELTGLRPKPACHPKHPHASAGKAEAAIRGLLKTGRDNAPQHPLLAYRCRHCGQWHVGHDRPVEERRPFDPYAPN